MAGFGNYPNMGHCAIENTTKGMRQVLEGFSEVKSIKELRLNQYEERAYKELYELCENMIAEMNRFEEVEDDEEEFDEDDE